MEWMRAGGALMWVLLFMSVAALAVVIERLLFYRSASADAAKVEESFGRAVSSGDVNSASSVVNASDTSLHRVFRAAFAHWLINWEEMKLLLEQSVRRELYRWEKHLGMLEVTGKLAPLIGLLGTVLGMLEMFQSMTVSTEVTSSAVTGGIWKALYTTVMGLCVAIPVIFAHHFLNSMVDAEEETLNRAVDYLMREHYQFISKENKENKKSGEDK